MKIAIELNDAQFEQLRDIARALGVSIEALAEAAVADLVSARAATQVLTRNTDGNGPFNADEPRLR